MMFKLLIIPTVTIIVNGLINIGIFDKLIYSYNSYDLFIECRNLSIISFDLLSTINFIHD